MRVIPRFRRRPDEERTGTMTVMEHLEELRHRIVVSLIAIACGAVVGWFLYAPFMRLILGPYCNFVSTHPEIAPSEGCRLNYLGVVDGLVVKLKIVLFLGLVCVLPIVLYQLWAFITPGLTARERKWALPFVFASTVLFLLGGVFAYVTLPKALDFLLGFAGEFAVPLITFDRYVGFVTLVTLAFGLSFLFPVILVFLELVGILTPRILSKWRRWAILGIAVFAAVITPSSDPYTMLAMMIPMYLFYEASIIIGRILKR
jgi:sec-independent protein translocase protein TatC